MLELVIAAVMIGAPIVFVVSVAILAIDAVVRLIGRRKPRCQCDAAAQRDIAEKLDQANKTLKRISASLIQFEVQ